VPFVLKRFSQPTPFVGLAACALALVIAAAIATGVASAYSPVGSDFRISNVGADTVAARDGTDPAVAYNPTANEYLVVWRADGLATDDQFEIFGQRVSAAGAELGADFRISNAVDVGATRDASDPAVAYNSTSNEYLVVWRANQLAATIGEFEVFGQRVSAAGAELGVDFRISTVGTDTDTLRFPNEPAVAYGSTPNEYLVTWDGDGLATDDENEIFGQRVSATGAEVGTDFQISNATAVSPTRDAFRSAVAYGSAPNEYLVTWQGDQLAATDEEFEIFGQRVNADGTEDGSDFRISTVGTDTDTLRSPLFPAVAYGSTPNEYLVTWDGDGLATNDEVEIFGQRLDAAGAEVGTNDFRISTAGMDTDTARAAAAPAVAYSGAANEYLVAWNGDGLATNNEFEIFGQRLDAAGAEVGTNDFRISTVGTDTDILRGAGQPAIAYGSAPDEYLVAWEADGLATDNENEIFGHRLALPAAAPVTPTPTIPVTTPAAREDPQCAVLRAKLKKAKSKKKKRKIRKRLRALGC
jgi:hypothetical protein